MNKAEINYIMDIAKLTAKRSSAVRLQVGAVVLDKDDNYVASGYNGTIRGYKTNYNGKVDETGNIITDPTLTVHAECNVIAHAARRGISLNGGTVFCTHSPCTMCTMLMIQSGIKKVVYAELHHSFVDTENLYGDYIKLTKWSDSP